MGNWNREKRNPRYKKAQGNIREKKGRITCQDDHMAISVPNIRMDEISAKPWLPKKDIETQRGLSKETGTEVTSW